MLTPGTVIGGYRVEELIAAGGMGTVYRATQLSLGRVVALKLLSEELGREPAFRARFRREAVVQATLEHPHIVPVYEAGESPDGLFIAMRFLAGSNLEQLVGRVGRLEVLTLLTGIAGALDAAHAVGLVHRDLKPQNILVSHDHAYLADFGLSAAAGLSSMTSAGHFLGTADYVSPEQIRDEEPDARSDVYSFGAVLYRCLSGSVPFPRSTRVAVIYAQLEQPPGPASSLAPDLPPALDPVLARALSKDPAERQASAGELIEAARAALAEGSPEALHAVPPAPAGPGGARRETTTTRARRPASRALQADTPRLSTEAGEARTAPRRWRRAAVAGSLILIVLIGVAAGVAIRRASTSTPSLGPTHTVSADGASVAIPSGWPRRSIALPELFARGFAAAGPPATTSGAIAVGLTRGFGPSLVPTALRAISGVPAFGPAVVTRTGRAGRLYRFASAERRYEILFVPTGHLTATAVCVAPRTAATGSLFSDCDRILTTLDDPAALGLDPRPAYAGFISRVLTTVSARERSGLARLRSAADAGSQAGAAASVAAAFTAAQAQVKGLVGHGLSSPEVGIHFGLRDKLGEVATAYRALAQAARAGDAVSYRAAAEQISAARADLQARLYELQRAGYTLSST